MLNFVLLDETFSVMLIILHPLNESIVATLFPKAKEQKKRAIFLQI